MISWRREWPITVVLLAVASGLAVVAAGHFRRGTILLAASVVFAAWLRTVLPDARGGLLKVRGKRVDVVTLAVLGLGLTTLALLVPPPS